MRALLALVFCVQGYLVLGQCSNFNPCSTDQTCCPGPSSQKVGCCPAPGAVCCSDGLHCCPSGTVCDLSKGACDNTSYIPLVFLNKKQSEMRLKSASFKKEQNDRKVYCPNTTYFCPDGQLCCRHYDGVYSCCPYSNGICCRDGFHCCPYNYRCSASSLHCLRHDSPMAVSPNNSSVLLKIKQPDTELKSVSLKKAKNERRVYCPGFQYFCPDGQLCCRHYDGSYSCCPYASGICCRDGFHCCPYGSRCDASSLNCLRAAFPMAVAPKRPRTPAFPVL